MFHTEPEISCKDPEGVRVDDPAAISQFECFLASSVQLRDLLFSSLGMRKIRSDCYFFNLGTVWKIPT